VRSVTKWEIKKEKKERKKESSAGRIFIKQTKQNKIQTITTP